MSLFLLRGVPGSGKSTWIEKNGFEQITVSSDAIRIEFFGIEKDADGKESIPQKEPGRVWGTVGYRLDKLLDSDKHCAILDATCIKSRDISKQLKRAAVRGLKCYVVDFWSDISLDECKRRNAGREEYKQVPEFVIERFYNDLANQQIPDCIESVLTQDEASALIKSELQ